MEIKAKSNGVAVSCEVTKLGNESEVEIARALLRLAMLLQKQAQERLSR